MSWFRNLLPKVMTSEKKGVPEGIWSKCVECQAIIYREELERNFLVCTKCDHHLCMDPRKRIAMLLEEGTVKEIGDSVTPKDVLKFRDTKKYKDRLSAMNKQTNETDALVAAEGMMGNRKVVLLCFNFNFIGGTMGLVVGERFVQGVNRAIALHCPVICFATSGGARMQEGLFSLMQMAKTSAALTKLSAHKCPYITVLTDPTMGGVSASLATLGDVILAEPKALIGFSGPRVIEQTIRETLPEGFQRSEFLLKHGAIDQVVDRRDMKKTLESLLSKLCHAKQSMEQ
jgi:acetyl-CoA carboxylase carboxyl transferase subunit beta